MKAQLVSVRRPPATDNLRLSVPPDARTGGMYAARYGFKERCFLDNGFAVLGGRIGWTTVGARYVVPASFSIED